MTEQHTPGEWVFRADDMMIVRLSPRGGLLDNLHIAEIKRQGPETEANARLIGAAPELLAALKHAAQWCEHNGCGVGRTAEMPWLEDALAAIAKANS